VKTEETALVSVRRQITVPEAVSQAVGLEPGDTVRIRATGPKTLEVTVLPRMTFEEWLERYRIEGPVDYEKVRREAEEAQADEYVRKFNEGKE
jgi:bifunctional DNA-binding transcriptional regulator/antitoxin component of YhaV-PrlF toxin-antitoxin module